MTDTTTEVARVLAEHRIECTGLEGVTCRGCRERGWMRWYEFERHQAAALAEAGLVNQSGIRFTITEKRNEPTHVHIERDGVPIVHGYIEGPTITKGEPR